MVLRKIFQHEHIAKDKEFLAGNSNHVPGEHEIRGGGTEIPRSSDSPDTVDFRRIFKLEYLANDKESLVENSKHVSGEHETRGDGMTKAHARATLLI